MIWVKVGFARGWLVLHELCASYQESFWIKKILTFIGSIKVYQVKLGYDTLGAICKPQKTDLGLWSLLVSKTDFDIKRQKELEQFFFRSRWFKGWEKCVVFTCIVHMNFDKISAEIYWYQFNIAAKNTFCNTCQLMILG